MFCSKSYVISNVESFDYQFCLTKHLFWNKVINYKLQYTKGDSASYVFRFPSIQSAWVNCGASQVYNNNNNNNNINNDDGDDYDDDDDGGDNDDDTNNMWCS